MKRSVWVLIILSASVFFGVGCPPPTGPSRNPSGSAPLFYRDAMREFVISISEYARSYDADFIVIPQNGIELVTVDGSEDGRVSGEYLDTISGHGQEDLFYGYNNDDEATPAEETEWLRIFLDRSRTAGNVILVTDYCSQTVKMDDSYVKNNNAGYVSFAADQRELDNIPAYPSPIYAENSNPISSLDQVRNFLYLLNTQNFANKTAFIAAVTATNYDLLIMDAFFDDGSAFTAAEINQLRQKNNGGQRLVLAYLSIGEAEDYRYYWNADWNTSPPRWLDEENPDWPGNYKVRYWYSDWQSLIVGADGTYVKRILDAGFDGVYLDIIEAYEYYE